MTRHLLREASIMLAIAASLIVVPVIWCDLMLAVTRGSL